MKINLSGIIGLVGLMFPAFFASAENVGFNAVVTEYGQLCDVVGDRLLEIDSLSVDGPVDHSDFETMLRGIVDGRITVLNLENANVEDCYIPMYALKSAKGLKRVILPFDLRSIGWGAFEDCIDLARVDVNPDLTYIDAYGFAGCKSLKSINLTNKMKIVSEYSFLDCSLDSIVIPPYVDKVGEAAFAGNRLKKIYIMSKIAPEAINRLVNCVDCDKDLFHDTTPADIPAYVPVGSSKNYRSVDGWDYLTNYIEIEPNDFPHETRTLKSFEAIVTSPGQLREVIPQVSVYIDSLVVRGPINESDFGAIWDAALEHCIDVVDLKNADVEGKVVPALAFAYKKSPTGVRWSPKISRVMLPDDIVEIGDSAFLESNIETVDFPERLPSLGKSCFSGCHRLCIDRLVIPEGVTYISDGCFRNCSKIKEVILPSSLESIGSSAFSRTNLKNIELPSSLVSIGDNAFGGCKFEKISFPFSLTHIGNYAFSGDSLKHVEFNEGLQYVGHAAFIDTALESVVFPDSEIEFGEKIFFSCSNLEKIVLPEWMKVVTYRMFSFCNNLSEVVFPSSLKEISDYAFYATGLKELALPSGVEIIGDYAFYLSQLESVTLPASVKKIGSFSFKSEKNLKYIKSYSPEPPESGEWFYAYHPAETFPNPVYVPVGSIDLYKSAAIWDKFAYYYEIDDSSSIDTAREFTGDEYVEIFDTAGRSVYCGLFRDACLPSGIYIVKTSQGVYKILR